MAAITISGLRKVYPNGVKAIDNLDLTIADGEFFALLGPSGCGKTTLLRTIAGLESASAGTITIGSRDVTRLPPGARNVAMVFQDYALYPHMDVADNIAYPLKIKKVARAARRQQATEAGAHLGLGDMMDRRPAQLSGGQQQRVALARAIACHPHVFLFDEPLSNLDARLRMEARTFLKRLHADLRTTTVYVTHDQSEALALADRMAVIDHGVIRQIGMPSEVFHRPANLFVAEFIGSTPMNLLAGVIKGGMLKVGEDLLPVPPPAAGQVREGAEVVLAARPEYMRLSATAAKNGIAGEVTIVEDMGASYLVTLERQGRPVQVVVPGSQPPHPGETAWAVPDGDRTLLYGQEDGKLIEGGRTACAEAHPGNAENAISSGSGGLA